MTPLIIPRSQLCQLDQRGDASLKDCIISETGANVVLLSLKGQ